MASDASEPADVPRVGLRRGWLVGAVAVGVLALDQATKHWAVGRLSPEGSPGINVIGSLDFQLAFNKGMAFSKGQGWGPVIAVVALGIIAVLGWFASSIQRRMQLALVGVVMGGAAGNLTDRIFRSGDGFLGGRVVDFIAVHWWPTFNIADSAVVVGGITLAILLSFQPDDPPGPDEPTQPRPEADDETVTAPDEDQAHAG